MKTRIFKSTLAALILLLLASCDGAIHYEGTIYDAQTREPIDKVKCRLDTWGDYNGCCRHSDSVGHYLVEDVVTMKEGRAEHEVEFSKPGYKTQIILEPKDVYLEKE